MIFWHDDQFKYGAWDDDRTPEEEPTRGYIEQVQRHIDEPILYPPDIEQRGSGLPCRG